MRYSIGYLFFAVLIMFIDNYVFNGVRIFSVNSQQELKVFITLPLIVYLLFSGSLGWYIERMVKRHLKELLELADTGKAGFRTISILHIVAMISWIVVMIESVHSFWIGLLHLGLLIDAISVLNKTVWLCLAENTEK